MNLEETVVCQEGALLQPRSENFLPALGRGAAGTDSSAGRRFQTAEVMFIVYAPQILSCGQLATSVARGMRTGTGPPRLQLGLGPRVLPWKAEA